MQSNPKNDSVQNVKNEILNKIKSKQLKIGVAGMGYVGLPLTMAFVQAGLPVCGFDNDAIKVKMLNESKSYIDYIPDQAIANLNETKLFSSTGDFSGFKDVDVILMCVPTPLTKNREPDMSYVVKTAEEISKQLRPGHVIVLESTTYPGTTAGLIKDILETTGYVEGRDFFLGYSPEREDPGNAHFKVTSTPKIVGADDPIGLEIIVAIYEQIVEKVVPVSSCATAEATKLTENIFRCVNIALINELKTIYDRMNIDIWEVVEAAKTKPFGYMPFYPGPGIGGHCIPIDPFYLTWKAREFGLSTRFIELAGEINHHMPVYVIQKLAEALDQKFSKGLRGSKILLSGLAYKKNVDDVRESPSLEILEILKTRGADVSFHDPFVPVIPKLHEFPTLDGMKSVDITPERLKTFDAILICTDHDQVDYSAYAKYAPIIVDTRNAMKAITAHEAKIVKA
ncbi:MAG: nucleotide sugar dehydrogenase [Candidatus Puniceispirillum sp.]|nr:nucleotide sugar dehydrogenase [Candidatus Puniceispirillum sp.]